MHSLTELQKREIARGLVRLGYSLADIARELELKSQRAVQKLFAPHQKSQHRHCNGYFGTKVCRYVALERRVRRGLSASQEQLRAILDRTINLSACFSQWLEEMRTSGLTPILIQAVRNRTLAWQYGLGYIAFLESMLGAPTFLKQFGSRLVFAEYQTCFLDWAAAPERQSQLKNCGQPEFNQLVKAHLTEVQLKTIGASWPSEECIQDLNRMLWRLFQIRMDSDIYAQVYSGFLSCYFGLAADPPRHNPADLESLRSMKAVENYRGGPNYLHCLTIWRTTQEMFSTGSNRQLLEDISQHLSKGQEASLWSLAEHVAPPPSPCVTPDTPLTDLQDDLETRLMNMLTEKCGLKTLADLARCSSNDLLEVTDIGHHYLSLIRKMLKKYGGHLSMPATEVQKWRERIPS